MANTVTFDVLARAKDQGFDKVGKSVNNLHSGVKKLALAVGGALAIGKAFTFIGDSVKGWQDHMVVVHATEQVIKSTGGAAQVTAKQVGTLTDSIEANTGVDGDLVQQGANMLLTFTNIRNEVGKGNDIFNQATQTVTDMSVALGQDTKNSAIQLGKALNDPIKGVTALQRVGVTFTDQQKKQIDTLVKSGHTLDAQKIILKELGKEFGGQAKAQETSGQKMAVAFHSLQDSVGQLLLPVLVRLADFTSHTLLPAFNKLVDWVSAHWPQISSIIAAAWNNYIKPALLALASFFRDRVLPAISTAVQWVIAHWPQISAVLIAVWNAIRPVLQSFMNMIKTIWDQVLAPAVTWIKAHWPEISTVAKVVFGIIAVAAKVLLTAIKLAFDGISLTIKITVAVIRGMWTAVSATWNNVRNAATGTKNWINARWNEVIGFFRGIPGKIASIASGMWNPIKNALSTAYTWVTTKFGGLVGFVKGLPGKIASAASGMWHGVTDAFKSAINAIIGGWNSLQFKVPGFGVGPVHFGGFTLGLPDIPYLAKGGITNGPTLAILGDNPGGREAITPLPRNGGLGGLGGPIVLEIRSGGSPMDELLATLIRKYVRVNGGNVQTVLGQG